MQHRSVRAGVATAPFVAEIERVDAAWMRKPRAAQESRSASKSRRFPNARAFSEEVATAEDTLPARAKILCLPPGRRVHPQVHRGDYYRLRNRHHLELCSRLGSWLKSGDKATPMHDGDQDRIHLIVDLLPAARMREACSNAVLQA